MIKKLPIILFFLFTSSIFSQTEIKVEFINETTVLLNDKKINKNTTFSEIKDILGEPIVYKKYVTGKINYHYENYGISLQTVNDNLLLIGFNYNWDGDKTFPRTSFTGKLKIDGIVFDKNSNEEILKKVKNVEFITIMPGFIISKPKTEKKNIFIALGFKDDKVTQIGFEFH